MAGPDDGMRDNLDLARFLREEQEYLDARAAYERALDDASARVSMPSSLQSNYSVVGRGFERAATDPWIRQSHPDLARAASRLVSEEYDYLALDDPRASHAQGNCSIISYTAEKFYEYAALGEMLYKLATDEEFRNSILSALGAAVAHGGWFSDLMIAMNPPQAGILESDESYRGRVDTFTDAQRRTAQRVVNFFSQAWEEFREAWQTCGLAHAVARAGVDGVFLAGEIVVAGVALRGLRFAYRLLPNGRHRVDVINAESGETLDGADWSTEALENKYGTPEENQVAGVLPDTNRNVADGEAREREPETRDEHEEEQRANGATTEAQRRGAEEYGVDPKWIDPETGRPIYPTEADGFPDGFDGPITSTTLDPSDGPIFIDRYGGPNGQYFAPEGTPFGQRAMVLSNRFPTDRTIYEVLRPLPVQSGQIAPWFDRPGGGTQYKTDMTVRELIEEGYIREVRQELFRDD